MSNGPGLAFLGCGKAAGMHAKTLRSVAPGARLFFASRDESRARDFSRRLGGADAFGDYDAALADPRVDAAVVVTPPASHLEWTLAALSAGKHVIVEKPAFLAAADFAVVEDAARSAGRLVMVAENYFYKPVAEALRRLIREERLGRLLFLHVNALKTQDARGWRVDPALAGGGALFEGGIHWVSLLAHLGPRVEEVQAALPGLPSGGRTTAAAEAAGAGPGGTVAGGVAAPPAPSEKSALVTLRYAGGAVAALSYSWEVPSLPGGLRISRIYGTEGTATFESNGLFLATSGRSLSFRLPGLKDLLGYRAMFRDFLEAMASGREPRFSLERARRDVEIVEAAYRSAGVGS